MPYSNPKNTQNFPIFHAYFSTLQDPRRIVKGHYFYPLEEILFLSISAVVSGANEWTSISSFGHSKLEWLRKFYPYKKGIPSHDVLGKLFARLDHKEFSKCFSNWINSLCNFTDGEIVAIDGKTMRGSADVGIGKSALHVVSAYASGNRLCLGQEVVNEKSNEIAAIPKLLEVLDLKGCQKKIAEQIREKKANYVLMLKDNQKDLKEQVERTFITTAIKSKDTQVNIGHGRIEKRECEVIDDLRFVEAHDWAGLTSIVRIKSQRCLKKTGESAVEVRYFISSLPANACFINNVVRGHWAIENNLHWLDVIFKEDESLKKKGNSANVVNLS